MADEKQKCPMCGTKLKMINGRMTCKSCGYYYRNANEQTDYGPAQQSARQQAGSGPAQQSARQQTPPAYGTAHTDRYGTTQASKDSASKPKQFWKILGGTILSVAVSAVAYFVVYNGVDTTIDYIRNLFSGESRPDPYPDIPPASGYYVPSQESQTSSDSGSGREDDVSRGRKPESVFFQALAQAIWEKSSGAISAEEYAQLTALEISRDEKMIYYQLDYGETMTLTYESSMTMKLSDLSCFTGLEYLSIDDDLSKGDLDGLLHLHTVYAENSIRDYLNILPDPAAIQVLSTEDSIFSNSLDGLEAFTGLQYLFVEYGSLEDISALTGLPDLLGLSLTGCDRLTDFSPLLELTGLQELSIESAQLKTIDFIRVMPQLTSLSVHNSCITDLNALADCPGITTLDLTGNYRIEDFTGLDTLPGLVNLTLELNYSEQMPAFQNLGSLDRLTLKYANDLSLLRNAPNVTYLCLERCAGWELAAVTAMQGLTTLEIHDFSSATESLAPLAELPKLEALDLSDTDVFGPVNEIFGIPTLYYLNLSNCRVALDFDTLPTNETLQCLLLDKVSITDAGAEDYDMWSRDPVKLSEHYDMFGHFPNLTDLYLEGTGIDSLAFVESLPRLQYLDITDNNVTSLKPLESLPDFRTVWCGGNTILENLPEDSPINVSTARD